MAQSLRQVRSRVKSVEGIMKMTRAMEMVAAAKLSSLKDNLHRNRQYFSQVEMVLNNMLASFKAARHDLINPRPDKKNILLCLITSDTGLCGNYNGSLLRAAEAFILNNNKYNLSLITVGRKGFNYFKRQGMPIIDSYTELYGHYSEAICDKFARNFIDAFLLRKADEVYVAYMNFVSPSRISPSVIKILNIEPTGGVATEYLTEPGIEEIIAEFIPLYISSKIRAILLSAFTAENSVRVMAMHEATDNAKEVLDDLILLRNKMRQADITRELIEVISAADALKG